MDESGLVAQRTAREVGSRDRYIYVLVPTKRYVCCLRTINTGRSNAHSVRCHNALPRLLLYPLSALLWLTETCVEVDLLELTDTLIQVTLLALLPLSLSIPYWLFLEAYS